MRSVLTALFLGFFTATAMAQDGAADMAVDDILRGCGGAANIGYCEATAATIPDDYAKAFAGAYGGQRNIAYCLSYGCDDATVVIPDYGCAWRMVIAAAGHAQFDDGDRSNLRAECGRLSGAGRMRAAVQAHLLFEKIYGRPLPGGN